VEAIFEDEWVKVLNDLSGGAKLSEVKWTYQESLSKTFRGINKFMN